MSTAKNNVVALPATNSSGEGPTKLSKRRLEAALKQFLEEHPAFKGVFSRAELLRDPEILPLIEELARQQIAAEKREEELLAFAEAKQAEAKRKALIKALQAETSDEPAEVEGESASAPRTSGCRIVKPVDPKELAARKREQELREEFPLVPMFVLSAASPRAQAENAVALRKILFEEMSRLGEEKETLEEVGESDRAHRCYRHRGWIKACLASVTDFLWKIGIGKSDYVDYFLDRHGVDGVRLLVEEDPTFAAIFRSFVDDELQEQIDRYAGLNEGQRERVEAMEQAVRERALTMLGESKIFGRKAEAPLDEAIGRVDAIRFDFDDPDTLREIVAELVDEVLIALGRKERPAPAPRRAAPKKTAEDRDRDRAERNRRRREKAAADRELRISMRGKSGGGGGGKNNKGGGKNKGK